MPARSAPGRHRGPRARGKPTDPLVALGEMALDPVEFTQGLLLHDPWPIQQSILRSVATNPRTAVKACHSSGKTFVASDAVLWWTVTYEDGMVITTAPTWTQVEKLLWGHIHRATRGGKVGLPKILKTELPIGPENYAIGLSTNEGVRFQGWHGRILIILDEAPGVLPEIWDAIDGIRAGGDVRVLALGQPATLGGHFYNAFHQNRATWECITISAFDTPNLAGICLDTGDQRFGDPAPNAKNLLAMSADELKRNPRPYLTTRGWVLEKWHEWGASGSPLWDVKVLGQFPQQSEDSLLSLAWVDQAKARKPGQDHLALRVGIDVAGPGEAETVVSIRQGLNRIALKPFAHSDSRGPVLDYLRRFKDRIEQVNCDSIGQGWYFAKHLEDHGFKVRYVNIQEVQGVDTEKRKDQKADYYWGLRDRFREGTIGGIDDPIEQAQLLSVKYEHDSRGRVVIVAKDDPKMKGVPSPDRAEADMLAYAPDVPEPVRRTAVSTTSFVTG